MKLMQAFVMVLLIGWAVPALAKLPVPTAEEAARKAAEAEKKAKGEEAAKAALEQAQDRVAQRYHSRHPHAAKPVPVSSVPAPAKK